MNSYRNKRKKSREKNKAREQKARDVAIVKAALSTPPIKQTLIKPVDAQQNERADIINTFNRAFNRPKKTAPLTVTPKLESKINESDVRSAILKNASARKDKFDQAKMAARRLADQKAAEAKRRQMMELNRQRQAVADARNESERREAIKRANEASERAKREAAKRRKKEEENARKQREYSERQKQIAEEAKRRADEIMSISTSPNGASQARGIIANAIDEMESIDKEKIKLEAEGTGKSSGIGGAALLLIPLLIGALG
jgi:hypothetical protein